MDVTWGHGARGSRQFHHLFAAQDDLDLTSGGRFDRQFATAHGPSSREPERPAHGVCRDLEVAQVGELGTDLGPCETRCQGADLASRWIVG